MDEISKLIRALARAGGEPQYTLSRAAAESDDEGLAWIEAMVEGDWPDPFVGDVVKMTPDRLEQFKRNFDENVREIDIMLDYEHGKDAAKGSEASGQLHKMEVRKRDDGKHSLMWGVKWLPDAAREIKEGKRKYFSAQWFDELPKVVNGKIEKIADVVVGGGLTNKPVMKGMKPVNLSEYKDDLEEFKEDPIVKTALAALTTAESAPMEHSEPPEGGGEAVPREQDSPIGRPAPLIPGKPADNVTGAPPLPPEGQAKSEGGQVVDLAKLRERLGLQADADEAAVEAAFNSVFEDATAFRAATEKANEARTFAEKYPDQAAKIERLEKRDREASIREFTERFERFKVKVGDGDEAVEREYGFAMPVIDKLRECARSFHEGGFGLDKVEDVLSTIAASGQDKAIVEFGERGSSRQAAETVSPDDAKKKVSDRVAELMKDDKLSRADAFRQAAEEMPDEVQAYRTGQPSPVGKDEE